MTEELVTFETAFLAKEKGFDEECIYGWETNVDRPPIETNPLTGVEAFDLIVDVYKKNAEDESRLAHIRGIIKMKCSRNSERPQWSIARPTQDLLERWLREVHNIDILTKCYAKSMGKNERNSVYRSTVTSLVVSYVDHTANKETYELAREAALLHALKLLP